MSLSCTRILIIDSNSNIRYNTLMSVMGPYSVVRCMYSSQRQEKYDREVHKEN
jgi:hypothetical protein